MKLLQLNHNDYKWLLFVAVLLSMIIAVTSCNPVKQVLKDQNKMKEVWEAGALAGYCVNDSIYVSDTTIVLDTLHSIDYKTDTVRIGDSVWIDRVEFREKFVTKKITIRDTAIVTDNSRINLLQKEISKHLDIQIQLKENISTLEDEKKAMKKERNKWRLYFFLLLGGFVAWLFRKPILSLIWPVGSQVGKIAGLLRK